MLSIVSSPAKAGDPVTRSLSIEMRVSGLLDAPLKAGHDTKMEWRFRHDRKACRYRDGAAAARRRNPAHPDAAGAEAFRPDRRRDLCQIREPAGHEFIQRSGCLRQARRAQRGRAPARRDLHVGRQSCPGGRLPCAAPQHSGHHRDADDDAVREGKGDRSVRRQGGAPWRDLERMPGPCRCAHRRTAARPGASL